MGEWFLFRGRQGRGYGEWERRGGGVGTGERREDPEDRREVLGEELGEDRGVRRRRGQRLGLWPVAQRVQWGTLVDGALVSIIA